MAPPGEPHDAEQPTSMWQELNRPRSEPHRGSGPAAALHDPTAHDPTAPENPSFGQRNSTTDRIDPQHLLLVGAGLFVAVTLFALSGLGGSSSGDGQALTPAAASTPDVLAAVDDDDIATALPTPTPETTVATGEAVIAPTTEAVTPTTTQAAQPLAMGLPASLLDTEQSQVYRLYRTALDREPDRSGFEFWSDQVRDGVPLEQLANEFLASAEYQDQFAAGSEWDNRAERLLSNAFGAAADDVELDAWRARFAGLDGADLLLAISEADETLVATGTLR